MPHHELNLQKPLEESHHREHDTERVTCPQCGSREVEKRWSAFLCAHFEEERLNTTARGGGHALHKFSFGTPPN